MTESKRTRRPNGTVPYHGDWPGYNAGCRCEECRWWRSGKHLKSMQNPEYVENRRAAARAQMEAGQARLKELRSKPCMDCGGTFPEVCMDFDHLPGNKKVDSVSRIARYSPAKLEAELAKCELVCANCHRIRTYTRSQAKRGLLSAQ